MSENIELHSLATNASKDSDIEEYHEINQDLSETTFSPKHKTFTECNDYDFFTQQDVKSALKDDIKKKKAKKKDKSPNLMDIISTELASIAIPIEKNVVSFVNHSAEQRNSYLERSFNNQRIFQKSRLRYLDSEHGLCQKQDSVKLNPVFLKVLDITRTEDLTIPVQYIRPANFNQMIADIDTDIKQSPKFLDIDVKDIQFRHHHEFSLEKLLSVKLNECYNDYKKNEQLLKDVTREMNINRETRDNLKKDFLKASPNKKDDLRFDHTLRKYTEKLISTKEKYLETLQKKKEVVHKIISLWSDLETVREKAGRKDTAYLLVVKKNILDEDEFEKEFNDTFSVEFNDMLDKMEYEFVSKYIEYKETKNTENLDDSAKRKIGKPKLHIDEEILKEEVERTVNNIVTKDNIDILLTQDENILLELSKQSKDTQKYEYYFEIYIDDVFVCASEHYSSKADKISNIDFNESFSVQILPRNKSLAMVLHENELEISTLKISLSDINRATSTAAFVIESFVNNDIIVPSSRQVGSGHNIKEIAKEYKVRLKSSNIFHGNLYTSCDVNVKMGWNEKLNLNDTEAVKQSMDIGRRLKRLLHGIDKPTIDILKDIISKIYGVDVTNDENTMNTLRNTCKSEIKSEETFVIDENSPEFIRFKLLHLRNIGGLTNIGNKLIPVHASQITTEQLNCLQKSTENEFEVQYYSDKFTEMDPIELQRFIGAKYVQKLNKNMLRNLNEHLLRKTHKDVVRDFKDLSLRNLFSNQSSLATLASLSGSTRQQLLSAGVAREQEIRIHVARAFNLPDRSAALIEEDDDELIAGFKVRPLRPFVRVSYRGVPAQTATAIGCHPTWNQTLKINTRLEPISSLHVHVFDEHREAIPDAAGEDSIRYRRCERWLGTVAVPLHSVLTLGELRGTFKISSPPMLFGYETLTKSPTQSIIPQLTQLMKKTCSFITLNITTNLSHLGGLHEYKQPMNTEDYLIKHLNTFITDYVNDFPSRNISLTFIDSSGKNKCCTQFLQPIILPDYESFPKNPKLRSESALSKSSGLSKSSSSTSKRRESQEEKESLYSGNEGSWRSQESQMTKLVNASLRYVSLIPTYEMTESHAVTLMGLELLKVLHGSLLDHTILLASYYLHLGLRCYVAVGLGLPRGPSAYVITGAKGGGWYVHDGSSGERSELRDVGCPLKTVDYVFDNENIWVNVQSCQDCESVSFDFTRTSDWRPVFDRSVFVMKQPPVSDPSIYSPPTDVERLRAALENRIREKVQKWRPHTKTIWNRYCCSLLREPLCQWEHWAGEPAGPQPAPGTRLKQLMLTYKMSGFPLNMPYLSTKSVLRAVKATGAHTHADPNAELALAVHVCAYPNTVLSVWVFLANITRL